MELTVSLCCVLIAARTEDTAPDHSLAQAYLQVPIEAGQSVLAINMTAVPIYIRSLRRTMCSAVKSVVATAGSTHI